MRRGSTPWLLLLSLRAEFYQSRVCFSNMLEVFALQGLFKLQEKFHKYPHHNLKPTQAFHYRFCLTALGWKVWILVQWNPSNTDTLEIKLISEVTGRIICIYTKLGFGQVQGVISEVSFKRGSTIQTPNML